MGLSLESSHSRPDVGFLNIPLEALAGTQARDSSDRTRGVLGSRSASAYLQAEPVALPGGLSMRGQRQRRVQDDLQASRLRNG